MTQLLTNQAYMMLSFFKTDTPVVYVVQSSKPIAKTSVEKLEWVFGNATLLDKKELSGYYIGPRVNMITPWSTNAVEICQNMGIRGISRIEKMVKSSKKEEFDYMLYQKYDSLTQASMDINIEPAEIIEVTDIAKFNEQEGLALSTDEVKFLDNLAVKLERPLTDSEVFGFSQVNSEHCRHKIFNGTFIIDKKEKPHSLFSLIKETSKQHPNTIVSAYKDNVAFVDGPKVEQFAPEAPDQPSLYTVKDYESIISIKAETHNFPTTVEPFNGAATGSGGEIRDRLAGGQGSIPLSGSAVYMTSYSRVNDKRQWEQGTKARKWLYHTPLDILIKASNGASDFGNKFGQPLINGSLLTFEHAGKKQMLGYDKVIMLAGGVGYGKKSQAQKQLPSKGDRIVIMGGDNYRIGMGGAAVSSTDTGEFSTGIELNAVQRSNPEMQKRVANAIRGLVESDVNPIVSIHDHGAGGHLNCLSELVEDTGGKISLNALPVGDPTLSNKELIGNESQERMGLVVKKEDIPHIKAIAKRERAPFYDVGRVTGDDQFTFFAGRNAKAPIDLALSDLFGSSPKTVMKDITVKPTFNKIKYKKSNLHKYLEQVLRLEAVACKDWLTNKVDRCVGGKVAKQQCCGELQLPLNNCGVMALDFSSEYGVATALGHAPISGLIDPAAGSRNAIAESLTNIVWAPLEKGLQSVSLSANWMWPCRQKGEDSRLYAAVEATSKFAIQLGINIPTGKDSLSMKQKYGKKTVVSPGTVVITAAGQCNGISKVVEPVLKLDGGNIYYIDCSRDDLKLGGSSLSQVLNKVGKETPTIKKAKYFKRVFDTVQKAIKQGLVQAGHDISSGGMITTLLEMCFPSTSVGAKINLSSINKDLIKLLFAENAGLIIQADPAFETLLENENVKYRKIGKPAKGTSLKIKHESGKQTFDVAKLRDIWYETSYLFDTKQSGKKEAKSRYKNYKKQPLTYTFPEGFSGRFRYKKRVRPLAAILREKGSNSEREMANALYRAGFDVKDVHMTDLISGRETLEDVKFLGAVGGFSNSDVLGSAKGWAGAIKYNTNARKAIQNFFKREDTLSIGICNGAQLFLELDLINPDHQNGARLRHNNSGKHESAFTSVTIKENNSVMLSGLAGSTLGIWISHGEGKFVMPMKRSKYNIVGTYGYKAYPSNPNGSKYNAAMICSEDGRHLATMPHLERSIYPWNWAHYDSEREGDKVSPWIRAFEAARDWCLKH